MANNQQLPRPNIPKAANKTANSGGPTSTGKPQAINQQQPPQQAQPQTQPSAPAQAPAQASVPAGLDPNSPGGAPPKLDAKGRVIGPAAQISGTRAKTQFGQRNVPANKPQMQSAQTQQNVKQAQMIRATQSGKPGSPDQAQPQNSRMVKKVTPGGLPQQVGAKPNIGQSGQQASQQTARPPIQGPAAKQQAPVAGKKQAKQPVYAGKDSKLKKLLRFIVGGVAVLAVVIFVLGKVLGGGGSDDSSPTTAGVGAGAGEDKANTEAAKPQKNVSLTYWGLWEPSAVLDEVFDDFSQENPGVTVNYIKQSHKDYLSRLKAAIASGNGPDVFRFHATWTPVLAEELSPIPSSVMTANEFEQTFYPVMKQQLQVGGSLAGIPLMYDGLALYYNKEILDSANEEVPKTWGELKTLAERLVVSPDGEMKRGGLAIGNTTNVEHWADIIGLLIYQNEGNPLKPMTSEVRDALRYYYSFNENPVFSTKLPSSTVAFAREEVAMMFAPSWRAHEVLHLNPDLDFAIAPVPKLSEKKLSWASYWAEGVSSKSKNQDVSWQLLKYMSSKEVMKKLYSAQSEIRSFGEIYPRRDLAEEIESEYVTAYLLDAENAQGAPLSSYTHDKTFNDKIIDYYQDALTSLASGSSNDVSESLQTLGQGVSQILRQYNVSTGK